MNISNKKYRDLIALAMSANGRRETLDLLYEAAKLNKNWTIYNLFIYYSYLFFPQYKFYKWIILYLQEKLIWMNTSNQKKIASYAILNALERILILNELDKESVFNEYKEWIINDYKKEPILFIREDPII